MLSGVSLKRSGIIATGIYNEVLVDLLMIQKEIHPSLFAMMDGTVYGDGAGPRTMLPRLANLLLASNDMVAIDAVASKIMGFEPFEIRKIKLAHEMGLGIGDIDKINLIGMQPLNINLHCQTRRSPVVFFDQLLRSSFIEPLLFKTWFFNMCILGSESYHDWFWYPLVGRQRIKDFHSTEWGRLFDKY
jgi:hypothetical protein